MILLWMILATGLAQVPEDCARPDLEWETSAEAASEKAKKEGKLVLVLHLSGMLGNDDRT